MIDYEIRCCEVVYQLNCFSESFTIILEAKFSVFGMDLIRKYSIIFQYYDVGRTIYFIRSFCKIKRRCDKKTFSLVLRIVYDAQCFRKYIFFKSETIVSITKSKLHCDKSKERKPNMFRFFCTT